MTFYEYLEVIQKKYPNPTEFVLDSMTKKIKSPDTDFHFFITAVQEFGVIYKPVDRCHEEIERDIGSLDNYISRCRYSFRLICQVQHIWANVFFLFEDRR